MSMNDADTSASSAMADCTPLTVASRSRTTAEMETFINEVSTTSTNIAIESSNASRQLNPWTAAESDAPASDIAHRPRTRQARAGLPACQARHRHSRAGPPLSGWLRRWHGTTARLREDPASGHADRHVTDDHAGVDGISQAGGCALLTHAHRATTLNPGVRIAGASHRRPKSAAPGPAWTWGDRRPLPRVGQRGTRCRPWPAQPLAP